MGGAISQLGIYASPTKLATIVIVTVAIIAVVLFVALSIISFIVIIIIVIMIVAIFEKYHADFHTCISVYLCMCSYIYIY